MSNKNLALLISSLLATILSSRLSTSFCLYGSKTAFGLRTPRTFRSILSTCLSSSANITTTTTTTTTTMTSTSTLKPPVARRDGDRVIYIGAAPKDWTAPRQADTSTEPLVDPPVALPDPYGWLRDDKRAIANTPIEEYLQAENQYTQDLTQHLQPLRDELYNEMLSSIKETDYTTPRPHDDFYYYTRTFKGESYVRHCRAPRNGKKLDVVWDDQAESPVMPGEEILLDVNQLAKGHSYCSTGRVRHSPSHKLLAYTVDFKGYETSQLYVTDIATGQVVDHDEKLECDGSVTWGPDDKTLFYIKMDDAHRSYQLYRRTLGGDNDKKEDELLFQEDDEVYSVFIYKSLDGRYLFIDSSSHETSLVLFLDLQDPSATVQPVTPRRSGVLYEVEYSHGQWWIASNVGGLANLALFTCPAVANSQDQWMLVQDSSGDTLFDGNMYRSLTGVSCFERHLVFSGREDGLPRVWVASLKDEGKSIDVMERLSFAEDAYDVGMASHYEFGTSELVVMYDSMVTPTQALAIDMEETSQRYVIKEKQVPGYDKTKFACERIMVKSRDGTAEIPVSMVYRRDVMEKHLQSGEPVHTHLYGYGSYGSCMEADFSSTRLSLLNRGIVYVIAHVRGGSELGRHWYEEPNGAKYLCKANTFNDFVDVGRWLVNEKKLTKSPMLSCEGRSAGGLLIGASVNQAPDLFGMAIAAVPFVDVVCTMSDARIPLTTGEWEEWGNPNEEKYHEYMMSYCPMQNIKKGVKYPAMLLTGGLHDPRVAYWEPAKWVASVRHAASPSSSSPICLKIDLSAGHFSASDRYKYLRELAFDFAFLLDQVGLTDTANSNES